MAGAGWRLRVEHATTFDYPTPARASYNEVRQIPVTTTRQTILEWKVTTTPPAPQYTYRDYWGTRVVAFDVGAPHLQLAIHSSSLVDTHPLVAAGERPDARWEEVLAARDAFVELVEPSRYTRTDAALDQMAAQLRAGTPRETVEAVAAWAHRSLEYLPGVTDAQTTAVEAFAAGRGVCQDFAHLALGVLRATGIPARYVSGYLHPDPEGPIGIAVGGESHAWIEAWTGGWWGLDPTNAVDIGLRHVVVARGRDYADVPPVRGIFAGGAEHETAVSVTLTRTA